MRIQNAVNPILAPCPEARPRVRVSKLVKAGSLSFLCLMASLSSRGFTLYNTNLHNFDGTHPAPPAADYDLPPDPDFSDCINRPNEHWTWPGGGAADGNTVTITIYFDSSFDSLFPGPNGPTAEAGIKAQIATAMLQWESAAAKIQGVSLTYQQNDSYARANPLMLDVQHTQTIAPFMDVRSATVHELGHILGFAHCDQGATANPVANFSYFTNGKRGYGPYGTPMSYSAGEVLFNFYDPNGQGEPFIPGSYGQEVMSQYSSAPVSYGANSGVPELGRAPGEIYHTLSWDELDGFAFIYGLQNEVQFVPASSEASANLVFQAAPIYYPGTTTVDKSVVCQGVPYGLPDPMTGGIAIQRATITYNTQSSVPIGFEPAGFNYDITTTKDHSTIYSATLSLNGTENTTLVGPTFDNFDVGLPLNNNPNYVFQETGVYFEPLIDTDTIEVTWSGAKDPIPAGTLLHVGVTPDVWDWVNYSLFATLEDEYGNPTDVPVTPVHIYTGAKFYGLAAVPAPNERISASCLTTIGPTNTLGVRGLALTSPMDSTLVYNLRIADVTGMGLTLSNLNSMTMNQLQQNNQLITVTNFGSTLLDSNQQFVVILQGSASYLPGEIATNGLYLYLNQSNLVDRELFAAVTSSNQGVVVNNYTLLNMPPIMAAPPTVTWANPAPIIYGTPLTSNQLNATAITPGTFTYVPPAGTILPAGTNVLTVLFTPNDTNDYTSVNDTVGLVVLQATPVLTWPNPAPVAYGTPLSSNQLDAAANVPGAFTYNPPAGTVLPVGTNMLTCVFTALDTNDYASASDSVSLIVTNSTNINLFLPVYQVTQAGATFSQATTLAASLNIPSNMLGYTNGMVSFVDPTNYMAVPTITLTNLSDPTISNLVAQTKNPYPPIPIGVQAIDFATLTNQPVFDTNAALALTSNALGVAQLNPQFGTSVTGHTVFTAFVTNADNTVSSANQCLDTQVNYQFSLPSGATNYPLIGAGAQVQLAYGPNGNVTRLLYAARQLAAGSLVQIISPSEASNRVFSLLPANAQVKLQLVYWSPSFAPGADSSSPWNPATILPWYACKGTIYVTNPNSQIVQPVNLRVQLIPATADTNFVPSLNFSASAAPGSQIVAHVSASGGRLPYTYLWAGSDPTVSTNTGASITYTPRVRIAPPPMAITRLASSDMVSVSWPYPSTGFVLESAPNLDTTDWSQVANPMQTNTGTNVVLIPASGNLFLRLRLVSQIPVTETVSVRVTDANGVWAETNQSFTVLAEPFSVFSGHTPITYGCESPNDPGPSPIDGSYAPERIAWQHAMSATGAGGGSQSFCWLADSSWPGDYIEPVPAGTLSPTPWVNGDADFANWGINTANIMLYNGDACSTYFCEMYPGATLADYNNYINGAELFAPSYPEGIEQVNGHYYQVNEVASWGSIGPNDSLDWLCMYACQTLTNDVSEPPPWQRWGPAFNGLHSMIGFFTTASDAGVGFAGDFPGNMLGAGGHSPQTVVQSWINAALSDHMGTPAAMGPIYNIKVQGFDFPFYDYGDHYWGKGSVGLTIPPSLVNGWWYVKGTDSVQFFP
jgi:hypothetical protein